MSNDKLQRAARYLVGLRQPGPRPISLPAELAPATQAEAYEVQLLVARELNAKRGAWKVSMSGESGTYAPIFASDLRESGDSFSSPIAPQLGIEPEVAFRLQQDLPPGRRYSREDVTAAIGSAHAAIEIVISRFQRSETAAPLDRLADNISNGGLILGPGLQRWQSLNLRTLALTLRLTPQQGSEQVHSSQGGHPQGDPLLPMAWIVNARAAEGFGMRAGEIVTTGSFAGVHYAAPGTRVRVEFAGLGAVDLSG